MDFATALIKLWPNGDQKVPGLLQGIIDSAPSVFAKYKIQSPLVLAHLMAQMSEECGAGTEVIENLNYSAERMTQVWPSRFPTISDAAPYAHNSKALANKVYNGVKPDGSDRMGNRPDSNDGWNYRGRGGCQTTGRNGYARVSKATGLDLINNPDLVVEPRYFLECAVADFIACGCLPYAEQDDIVGVTKRLNGGTIGLSDRKNWLARWKPLNVAVPELEKAHDTPKSPGPISPTPPKPTPPAPAPVPWWKRFFGFG